MVLAIRLPAFDSMHKTLGWHVLNAEPRRVSFASALASASINSLVDDSLIGSSVSFGHFVAPLENLGSDD
jgi:hypothetical protein